MSNDAVSRLMGPGSFSSPEHFYPRVLNAHIHPLVGYFLGLDNARIAQRYCHMHPEADGEAVRQALRAPTEHFRWGGADLFYATTEEGMRRMVIIETNSSPSGQKSMPILFENREQGGYRELLERAFLPMLKRRSLPRGELAVLYDKNEMEVTGYAATLADLTGEAVHVVPWFAEDADPPARVVDGVVEIRDEAGQWRPIRAALRYVTQRPWSRIPPVLKTALFNPTLVCLAGGRNKLLAAKAYDLHNASLEDARLRIQTPETIWDVSRDEVPMWIERMGGVAVVKVPYSNAGQGVYTITSAEELDAFMETPHRYDRFIVQALIGNIGWSSRSRAGRLYHMGTVPNARGEIFVADLRFMVGVGPDGAFPVAVYARRARSPLSATLGEAASSWDMLGTNLSVKRAQNQWDTESQRLMLMDHRDFNQLGLGLDDLVEAYLQTVLSMAAIDQMAIRLVNTKGRFRRRFFESINPDPALAGEICAE